MSLIRIRGDFNARDNEGRVRLDTVESEEDIAAWGAEVWSGRLVLICDEGEGGYQAAGVLEFVDGSWRARIAPRLAGERMERNQPDP